MLLLLLVFFSSVEAMYHMPFMKLKTLLHEPKSRPVFAIVNCFYHPSNIARM